MDHVTTLTGHFTEYAEMYGYLGIFLWFLIIDELVPLPDEIPLITVGYLCSTGVLHYPLLALAAAFAAFMIVDVGMFFLVSTGSRFAKRFERKMNQGWFARYKQKINDHLPRTLFILAFIPRMRVFSPALAAVAKVPAKRFFAYDALSLGAFVTIYVGLGYFFHEGILALVTDVGNLHNYLFITVLAVILLILFFVSHRARRRLKAMQSVVEMAEQ